MAKVLALGAAFGIEPPLESAAFKATPTMVGREFVSKQLLPKTPQGLVLAFDEVNRLFNCPFHRDFFAMLRAWHNRRATEASFRSLSMILASSTTASAFIEDLNQSPFNVAIPLSLRDFHEDEVRQLNTLYGSPLHEGQVQELYELVAGHPYLTCHALYCLASGWTDVATLIRDATTFDSPFQDHLHTPLKLLEQPELKNALALLLDSLKLDDKNLRYRLLQAGVVREEADGVVFRNGLYERLFRERLYD